MKLRRWPIQEHQKLFSSLFNLFFKVFVESINSRALRRRKLFPRFSNLNFAELAAGLIKPLEEEPVTSNGDSKTFTIKGIAVGSGSIKGKARVVKTLAEANQIEHNDILIVPYTDVGWSPYFPMIGGLVTELGGLISHGRTIFVLNKKKVDSFFYNFPTQGRLWLGNMEFPAWSVAKMPQIWSKLAITLSSMAIKVLFKLQNNEKKRKKKN